MVGKEADPFLLGETVTFQGRFLLNFGEGNHLGRKKIFTNLSAPNKNAHPEAIKKPAHWSRGAKY